MMISSSISVYIGTFIGMLSPRQSGALVPAVRFDRSAGEITKLHTCLRIQH